MYKEPINTFWYLSNNFGDAVTHFIIDKLFNKTPVWVEPTNDCKKYFLTGSILNVETQNAIVWGSGIAWQNNDIPNHDIRAVRGLRTLDKIYEYDKHIRKLTNTDISSVAIGDPVLLLPNIYNPDITKTHKIGVIPHYIDSFSLYQEIAQNVEEFDIRGIKIIDINLPVKEFVDEILSCETIVSSSLHGIICADAYKIPSAQIVLTDKIGGDGFKYIDWFSNYYNRIDSTYDLQGNSLNTSIFLEIYQNMAKCDWSKSLKIDIEKFYESSPIK